MDKIEPQQPDKSLRQKIREKICTICGMLEPDGDCPIVDGATQCTFRNDQTQDILAILQSQHPEELANYCLEVCKRRWANKSIRTGKGKVYGAIPMRTADGEVWQN